MPMETKEQLYREAKRLRIKSIEPLPAFPQQGGPEAQVQPDASAWRRLSTAQADKARIRPTATR
jgi:hypothetical protein